MLLDSEYHRLRVADVVAETADASSFVLDVPVDLRDAFAYRAGQYCTFRAEIGGETVARSYSMSSAPETGEPLTVTVKRVPGGRMSKWMIDSVSPGDLLEVLHPAGLFVLRPAATPIVAFAGGSGITPIMSIVKSALATTDRSIRVVYANRSANDVIFADALAGLEAAAPDRLAVHHHLDSERGFLDAASCAQLVGDRPDADFYVCGPTPYMQIVEGALAARGVDRDRVFVERFALADDPPGTDAPAAERIVVRLDRRKHTIEPRAGDTILEACRRAGLRPPSSCESGSCATCMAHLDEGTVRMRANSVLTPEEVEEGWILTCQSLPISREVAVSYDL
jgi:3-ketosteroid 9alpha-monooxygenase subunit B